MRSRFLSPKPADRRQSNGCVGGGGGRGIFTPASARFGSGRGGVKAMSVCVSVCE